MRKVEIYKCPVCGMRFKTLNGWGEHLERLHPDTIPEGYSYARYFYFIDSGKTHGNCVECHKPTEWNEVTWKYKRYCNNPECKKKYCKTAKSRMVDKYGKVHILNDPEQQRKMAVAKSKWYTFKDGGRIPYLSSYEKDFLYTCEFVLGMSSKDIIGPSPHTYTYMYEGKQHFYIPDFYIPDLNLEIEIKDGGDNPNMHHKIQAYDKQTEIEKDKVMLKNPSVLYFKVVNKQYEAFYKFLLECKCAIDDDVKANIAKQVAMESITEYIEDEIAMESVNDTFRLSTLELKTLNNPREFAKYKGQAIHEKLVANYDLYKDHPWDREHIRAYGLDNDGILVGYMYILDMPDGSTNVDLLYVDPEYRRKGIATYLLKLAFGKFGVDYLAVEYSNVAAQKLYKKFGLVPNWYTDTALIMSHPSRMKLVLLNQLTEHDINKRYLKDYPNLDTLSTFKAATYELPRDFRLKYGDILNQYEKSSFTFRQFSANRDRRLGHEFRRKFTPNKVTHTWMSVYTYKEKVQLIAIIEDGVLEVTCYNYRINSKIMSELLARQKEYYGAKVIRCHPDDEQTKKYARQLVMYTSDMFTAGMEQAYEDDDDFIEIEPAMESGIYDVSFKDPEEVYKAISQRVKYAEYSKLKSPDEVFTSRAGSCHDQARLAQAFLKHAGVSPKLNFFIAYKEGDNTGGNTHTFVTYEKDKSVYWFETAWDGECGIHKYPDMKTLKADILAKHRKTSDGKKHPDLEFRSSPAHELKIGMNLSDYVNAWLGDSAQEVTLIGPLTKEGKKEALNAKLDGMVKSEKFQNTSASAEKTFTDICKGPYTEFINSAKSYINQFCKQNGVPSDIFDYDNPANLQKKVHDDIAKIQKGSVMVSKGFTMHAVTIKNLQGYMKDHNFSKQFSLDKHSSDRVALDRFVLMKARSEIKNALEKIADKCSEGDAQLFLSFKYAGKNEDADGCFDIFLAIKNNSDWHKGMKAVAKESVIGIDDYEEESLAMEGYFKVLKSDLDENFKPKKKLSLSQFTKKPLTKDLIKKFKGQGKLIKYMRDSDPKYDDECVVWVDGDKYVGSVTYDKKPDEQGYVWITGLDVGYDYLGAGLGSQILEYAMKAGANALGVQRDNEIAMRMYLKHGFKISDISKEAVAAEKTHTYNLYLDPSNAVESVIDPLMEAAFEATLPKVPPVKVYKRPELVYDNEQYYPLYIILMRNISPLGSVIRMYTKEDWSHSLISFEPSMQNMYTFGNTVIKTGEIERRGFGATVESFKPAENHFSYPSDTNYIIYVAYFKEKQIKAMRKFVNDVFKHRDKYKYNINGLITYMTGKAYTDQYSLFCSQFVAFVLRLAKPEMIEKDPSLYSPGMLAEIPGLVYVDKGVLKSYNAKKVEDKTVTIFKDLISTNNTKAFEFTDNLFDLREYGYLNPR